MPMFKDLIDKLQKSWIFLKLDLWCGHQIQIQLGDEWKIAFKTRDSFYEWKAMPFGLCNTPRTFIRLMNEILKLFLEKLCNVYFDEILVFNINMESHLQHLTLVLNKLREHKLYINFTKCKFVVLKVRFLGFIIGERGVHLGQNKIEAI